MNDEFIISEGERDSFITAVKTMRSLYPTLVRLKADLDLEQSMGFKQLSIIDFSEIYRFMHPEYVKLDRKRNLLIVHLMFERSFQSKLNLITPYYYELINHLNLVAESMKLPVFKDLLEDSDVKKFMKLMSEKDLSPEGKEILADLMDKMQNKIMKSFADLVSPRFRKKVIVEPIDRFIDLVDQGKVKFWMQPTIASADLLSSKIFKEVLDPLEETRGDRPIANRVDALAAAFVHEANKILFKEKKYAVIVTGSLIPLLIYRFHPFKYQYINLPIERDLNYVASRIYFFTKYKDKPQIIDRLEKILPLAEDVLEVGELILDRLQRTEKIVHLPPNVLAKMQHISHPRKIVEEMIKDMSAIMEAIARDISVQIETRTSDYRTSLFDEIYGVFGNDISLPSEIQSTMDAVEGVLGKLEKRFGAIPIEEKIAIMGKSFESEIKEKIHEMLRLSGFETIAQVSYKDINPKFLPVIPDIILKKNGKTFLIDVKIVVKVKRNVWVEEASRLKTTTDILVASKIFGNNPVLPILILINSEHKIEYDTFSKATGIRILALSRSKTDLLKNARTEKALKRIGMELFESSIS